MAEDGTLLYLAHPKLFEDKSENSSIALGVLLEDGWRADRIVPNQRIVLYAAPVLTVTEEQRQAVQIAAMKDEHALWFRKESRMLGGYAIGLSCAPLVSAILQLFLGRRDEFDYDLFNGLIMSCLTLALIVRNRAKLPDPPPAPERPSAAARS